MSSAQVQINHELVLVFTIFYIGPTQTNIYDQYNHIKTLADLVSFLCTDQAHAITGQSIPWRLN